MHGQGRHIRFRRAESTTDGAAFHRLREAMPVWMEPSSPSRQRRCFVDRGTAVDQHHSHENRPIVRGAASDTRAHRLTTGSACARSILGIRLNQSSAPRQLPAPGVSGASSDRMSIRQPVRRAASRAFWPSLPIARDK